MRPLIKANCPSALPQDDVIAIRQQHLPYRRELVLDAINRIPAKTMLDNQAFEAGAIAGRSILSLLGIRHDRRKGCLAVDHDYQIEPGNMTDDVKAPDIGGTFVDIGTLSIEEQSILSRFIHGVHKACAHFTWKSTYAFDVENYHAAARLIVSLLQRHIYQEDEHGTPPHRQ